MDDKNLYASPEADVDVDNSEDLASRWMRLLGAIIDGILITLVVLPVVFILGLNAQGAWLAPSSNSVFMQLTGFAVYFALNGYLLATAGQTIGKRIVGTRIVSVEDGKILPLLKLALLRILPFSLLGQVPVIGPFAGLLNVLFIFGPHRRCLHDYIAGTRVVNA